ncbi:MAG: LamG domain-containing protein [Bdellovibrionales bacterium]|nr:LamG domain-containing protein [Bdellovibrionales bacterium]
MLMRYGAAVLLFLFSLNSHQARAFTTPTGLSSGFGNQNVCRSPSRTAWMPKANNIVGLWHLDGPVGNIANSATIPSDFSTGPTLTATIASSTLSYADSTIANFRQAVTATGNTGDILQHTGTSLDGLTAGTWSFWVNTSIPATNHIKLFYKSNNNSSSGWWMIIRTTGEIEFHKVYPSTNLKIQTCPLASGTFNNSWHHIVGTWAGTSAATDLKIYMDGTELISTGVADARLANAPGCANYATNGGYTSRIAGSGSWTSDAGNNFILFGGTGTTNPVSTAFSGKMDEFMIWNVALSAAEVATLYKLQKCN